VVGPGDYRDSAWFNRTRHVDELFVPSSCCVDNTQRRQVSSSSVDEPRVCQLDAILLSEPGNKPPVTALKTRVYNHIAMRMMIMMATTLTTTTTWMPAGIFARGQGPTLLCFPQASKQVAFNSHQLVFPSYPLTFPSHSLPSSSFFRTL